MRISVGNSFLFWVILHEQMCICGMQMIQIYILYTLFNFLFDIKTTCTISFVNNFLCIKVMTLSETMIHDTKLQCKHIVHTFSANHLQIVCYQIVAAPNVKYNSTRKSNIDGNSNNKNLYILHDILLLIWTMHIKYTIIINDCKLRYCNYNMILLMMRIIKTKILNNYGILIFP